MQTHGGSFRNSFSKIQLYTSWFESRKPKFSDIGNSIFRKEKYNTAGQWSDTSWLKSRPHKFTDIGNSIFLLERFSTAAKFSEGFTPYSLFSLNCREQQSLKTSTSSENHRTTKFTS